MRIIEPYIIKLDIVNKQVYGFMQKSDVQYISACDYDGGDQKTIANGTFNKHILAVFGDSLYFIYNDRSYIMEMNISNRILSRSIPVYKDSYYDLIVVHSLLQPVGELS